MDVATPPRVRVQRYVQPGVTFANAISGTVIWNVDQRVPIGVAIREISKLEADWCRYQPYQAADRPRATELQGGY